MCIFTDRFELAYLLQNTSRIVASATTILVELLFFFRLRIQEGHSLEVPELNFIRHQSAVSFGIWLVFTHKFSTFLGELGRLFIYGSFLSMKTFHMICPLEVRLHKQQLRIPRASPLRDPQEAAKLTVTKSQESFNTMTPTWNPGDETSSLPV